MTAFILQYSLFTSALQQFNLVYRYTLPQTTAVSDLLRQVAEDLRQSPSQYHIGTPEQDHPARSGSTGLHLLQLHNRGVQTGPDSQARLRPIAVDEEWTIGHLAADKHRFVASSGMCIEERRFVIHLGMLYFLRMCTRYLISS